MLMRFSRTIMIASLICLISMSTMAHAQPKGGEQFFGAKSDSFNEKTLTLPKPNPPAPGTATAGAPPAVFAGDGILPPAPPPKLWTGGAEFGLNGATGNSEIFNLRAGINARRKTATNLLDIDLLYQYGKQSQVMTQNQALFNLRDEVMLAGSPFTAFVSNNTEFDDLKAYRFRVGVYGGIGAVLHESDDLSWRVRAGAGIVRLLGQPENRWVPEAIFGTDLSYKLTDRQSIVGTADYYPRIDRWEEFRVRARVAYQIVLDPKTCTILRFGIQDRYDSDPGSNSRKNDLTYFTTLGFSF